MQAGKFRFFFLLLNSKLISLIGKWLMRARAYRLTTVMEVMGIINTFLFTMKSREILPRNSVKGEIPLFFLFFLKWKHFCVNFYFLTFSVVFVGFLFWYLVLCYFSFLFLFVFLLKPLRRMCNCGSSSKGFEIDLIGWATNGQSKIVGGF